MVAANGPEGPSLRGLYEEVLIADGKLKAVIEGIPSYLRRKTEGSGKYSMHIMWQRKTFAISLAHKVKLPTLLKTI